MVRKVKVFEGWRGFHKFLWLHNIHIFISSENWILKRNVLNEQSYIHSKVGYIDDVYQSWYFSENNRCVQYGILHPAKDIDLVEEILDKTYQKEGEKWIDRKDHVIWTLKRTGDYVFIDAFKY